MAWTTPTDKATGDVITAAIWNASLGVAGNMAETAAAKVTTAGDVVYATGANALARLGIGADATVLTVSGGLPAWIASSAGPAGYAYKTSPQTFTTTTTLASVSAQVGGSGGVFAFTAVSGAKYLIQIGVVTVFGGTGGLQMQLLGPMASNWYMLGHSTAYVAGSSGAQWGYNNIYSSPSNTINFLANSSGGSSDGNHRSGVAFADVIAHAGGAGTITLRAAQSSANGTTTLDAGSFMVARRLDA